MVPTIVLIGGTGQLGWELHRCLLGVSALIVPERAALDLARPETIRNFLLACRPHLVINAAAWTDVERGELEGSLAFAVNCTGVSVLVEVCRQIGAGLLHFSSDYVFDGSGDDPWRPDSPVAPLSKYGHSKLAGERAVLQEDLPAWVVRTSWLYSTRRRNFLLTIAELLKSQEVVRVVNDQYGAPTWARVVAQAITYALVSGLGSCRDLRDHVSAHTGIYHVSCKGETTWYDLALRVRGFLAGQGATSLARLEPMATSEFGGRAARPRNSRLDCSTFELRFGMNLPPWESALALCVRDLAEAGEWTSDRQHATGLRRSAPTPVATPM